MKNRNTSCINCAGGVFMCRRDQLLGFCVVAFGLGLFVGNCFESGWLPVCIGVGLILGGLSLIKQK